MFSRIIILILTLVSLSITAKELTLEIGDIPPNYLGRDKNGNEVTLDAYKGKVVIISFWASWCSPCLKELPVLENIQNKGGLDKIKVIAINFKESKVQYRRIKRKLSSLNLTLTHDRRGRIGKKFGVEAIPNLFIIGKDGKLVFHKLGYGESSVDEIVNVLNKQFSTNKSI